MNRDELRHLIRGPVAAVATPFNDRFELDHGRMEAATEYWVENGLTSGRAVIKVASFIGEIAMLRDEELFDLLRTVVRTADGKAVVMCGLQHKDTLRTIEDIKRIQDLGVVGVQLAPPIHHEPTQDDMLRYFEAISSSIEIGIMIYNMYWVSHGYVTPDTIRRMADFEHVVAIKWSAPTDSDYEEMRSFVDTFNVIDNDIKFARCHRLGGHGYIDETADIYPPHDLRLWELLESGNYAEAQALYDHVNMALRAFDVKVRNRSGGYPRMKKGLMELMGYPMGPPRPPTLPLSADEKAELRELVTSFGWPVVAAD